MAEHKDEFLKILGDNIKRMRKEKGLTQTELAKLCGFDSENSRSTISKIEKGVNDVPASTLKALAKALGTDVCELTKRTEDCQKKMLLENLLKSNYGNEASEIIRNFLSLDDYDQKVVSGVITTLLQGEKYSNKKESSNVKAIS